MNQGVHPSHGRLRGLIATITITAMLVLGVVALNWPITFASANGASTSSSALQSQPTTSTSTSSSTSSSSAMSASDVIAKSNPAVVTITNYQPMRDPQTGQSEGGQAQPFGVGSGYIIDEQGHVVTNWHVVEGGTSFEVQFQDGTTVTATLLGSDRFQDVGVLKLDLKAGQKIPGVLSYGDSSKMRSGDEVIAIGSPYGEFTNTASDGTIGAVDRSLDTGRGYELANLIQHSAPIYEGNSGGPLLNLNGEVIGMNVAKANNPQQGLNSNDQSGIGFAIESNALKDLVKQIIDTGKVARPYIGVQSQLTIDGQQVISVEAGGPASKTELQADDIITGIDGQTVDGSHSLLDALLKHKPGDTVKLDVNRGGETLSIAVTLGERPADTQ